MALTEAHGMAHEVSLNPHPDVKYTFIEGTIPPWSPVRSPIKGFFRKWGKGNCDLIESIISPAWTKDPWIYSLACFQEAMAFSLFGAPTPHFLRLTLLKYYFSQPNLKKIIFWSKAGFDTLKTYGKVDNPTLLAKSTVVYPGIRKIEDRFIPEKKTVKTFLFGGDFFRKGGSNVIDCFCALQKKYRDIKLYLCCDEALDFNTSNILLKQKYLSIIKQNQSIVFGRVSRSVMFEKILPSTDIFLLPTYAEAFGMAIIEAMAFGIPVVSTNYMAIPEMISHGESGFCIDTSMYDCDRLFKGYVVNEIPDDFNSYVTQKLYEYVTVIMDDESVYNKMKENSLYIARTKFSFKERNQKMIAIYRDAIN